MAATGPAAADGQWTQVSHRDTVERIHHGAEYMLRMALSHMPETAKFEIQVNGIAIVGQP